MKNTNWFINILGLVVLILIIALLASPYLLVIYFPAVGNQISEISKSVIPWSVILLLILVFNEQLKWVIFNIGDLIKRTKKLGIGSSTIDTQQEVEGLTLSKEQIEELHGGINKIQQEKDQAVQALRYYFHRTIFLTIYRSQIEMLSFLEKSSSPLEQKQLRIFYEAAISRAPSLKSYPFENYLGYLKDNFLITFDNNGSVSIAPAGRDFLQALRESKASIETFPA